MKKLLNLIALGLVSALLVGCMRDGKDGVTVIGRDGKDYVGQGQQPGSINNSSQNNSANPNGGGAAAGAVALAVSATDNFAPSAINPATTASSLVARLTNPDVYTVIADLLAVKKGAQTGSLYLATPAFANLGTGAGAADPAGFGLNAPALLRFASSADGATFTQVGFPAVAAGVLGAIPNTAQARIDVAALAFGDYTSTFVALQNGNAPANVGFNAAASPALKIKFLTRELRKLVTGEVFVSGRVQVSSYSTNNAHILGDNNYATALVMPLGAGAGFHAEQAGSVVLADYAIY